MIQVFEIAVAIIILLDMFALFYKGIIRKDWGTIGSLAPMIFLIGVIFYDLAINNIGSDYFHTGIFLVVLGNLISNLFIITSKRFKLENYTTGLIGILKELKSKYDFIVDHVPVGIYVLNKLGRFEFVNQSFCDIIGYSSEELLTMTVYDILPNETMPEIRQKIRDRISNKVPMENYKTQLVAKDGSIKKIKVNTKHTSNGHDTITGSITLLEE